MATKNNMQTWVQQAFEEFQTNDTHKDHQLFEKGHIHDSFIVSGKSGKRYLLQKINHQIFKDIKKLSFNLLQLDVHLRPLFGEQSQYRFPEIYKKSTYQRLYQDVNENWWRLYEYIENAQTYDLPNDPEMAFEGARAFAYFQSLLNKQPITGFYTPISNFRNLPLRIRSLKAAIKRDVRKRRAAVNDLIDLTIEFIGIADEVSRLQKSNALKKRITHNDPKLNNVLFNPETAKAISVIDFDTIMPGHIIFDYGDIIRSFTTTAAEDSNRYQDIELREDMFEAATAGYINLMKEDLDNNEKQRLLLGAKSIIFMQAIRFLTDYLNGDIYYKISYEDHNQVRSRNQFALLQSLIDKENKLTQVINKLVK